MIVNERVGIMTRAYIKYILLTISILVGYVLLYSFSVFMFYFLIGVFTLPVVVLGTPVILYLIWAKMKKTVKKYTFVNIMLLAISVFTYCYITYRLDTYMSWSSEGNFRYYLPLFGF